MNVEFSGPKLAATIAQLKSPIARPLRFTEEQRDTIFQSLQPGDVLLTFTAGVSTNVLVPGRFKHAMVYVGATREGDLIEAVSEGVLLSKLQEKLHDKINQMVMLRPRLAEQDRMTYVSEVLSFRGQPYDFTVDFRDPSRKVCTEVIYCALNGRGGINFPLTVRAGRPTLIADDIATYHLRNSTASSGFECILFADDNPAVLGEARLMLGQDAELRLREFMQNKNRTARRPSVHQKPIGTRVN